MKEIEEIQVDEAIKLSLNKIAERLWSGHGAVMVGAGFSKNAHSSFPSWEELGDLFYEEAYGQKPSNRKYLNVSRLADEIQASIGRPELNYLLKSNIPDEVSEPSQLHIQLLELPWTDVFTTNYDTLLERACSSVTSRKYDVVVNQEDLVYSGKPRIIKLHGSFPSERPFIITEEDYRRYPMEFAPFVNTVQQALLENMLCLIGFSGDDPNFLHWIGWIRDNLGSTNSPKIYLVGIISLSDAQKKLLEQRNVVLVDFSKSPGVAGDHYKALDRFCKYLLSKKEEDNRLGWSMDQKRIDPDLNNHDKIAQLKDILGVWKSARLSYPGWCVLPEDQRTILWIFTQYWVDFICDQDNIPTPLDIEYAYELNWRLEKCLCPIQDNLAVMFEIILQKYLPFFDVNTTNTAPFTSETPDFRNLDLDSIRKMGLHLYLSMLRFYREEGLLEKWQDIDKKLDGLYPYLSPEQIAFLHYERTLYALFALDVHEVKAQIKAWPSNESLPFWETKRAGLLAEIGQVEDADRILEQSLRSIRSKLNLKPVTTDYSLVSQEAFTMLLLQYVRSSCFLKNGIRPENKDIQRQFMERWNILKQYKCDPWNEFKPFENHLEREPVEKPAVSEKKDFDIGRVTQTRRFGGNNKEAISAYAFLRLCEEVGIPFRISGTTLCNKSADGTLSRISKYSPYWTLATMIRIGDAKVVDHVFNRESLYKMNVAFADNLIDRYLKALEKSLNDIQAGSDFYADNFGVLLARIIPEILSRLCCKCSLEAKNKLLDFLLDVYKTDQRVKYQGISTLTKRLIDSYSDRQQLDIVPKLLEFPVLGNLGARMDNEFLNPFSFLRIDKEQTAHWNKPKIEEKQILSLLIQANSETADIRKWAISTLYTLYQLNLLGRNSSVELGKVLWSRLDPFGFPTNTNFYKFVYLDLPHPDNVDPVLLFKKYLQDTPFSIQKSSTRIGVFLTEDDVPVCHEIVGASGFCQWTAEEALTMLKRIVEWWDADKGYLKKDEKLPLLGSISEMFGKKLSNLLNVLAEVVLPALKPETDMCIKDTIHRLLTELREYGLPSLRAEAASIHVFPDIKKEIIARIEDALTSRNHKVVTDGLDAVFLILKNSQTMLNKLEVTSIVSLLCQIIKWRRKTGLIGVLNMVCCLIKEQHNFFTDELEGFMLNGLVKLADETNLAFDFADLGFSEKLEIRQSAARLAYVIFENYSKQGKTIPDNIKVWKEICRSEEEFAEIRHQWLTIDDELPND